MLPSTAQTAVESRHPDRDPKIGSKETIYSNVIFTHLELLDRDPADGERLNAKLSYRFSVIRGGRPDLLGA
jgi:hypothetical protein